MPTHDSAGTLPRTPPATKREADYVFYELTRLICPECRRPIDAHIVLRDGNLFMRKRCPDHGRFEALVNGDAHAYTSQAKFNKPGTIPLAPKAVDNNGPPDWSAPIRSRRKRFSVSDILITAIRIDRRTP